MGKVAVEISGELRFRPSYTAGLKREKYREGREAGEMAVRVARVEVRYEIRFSWDPLEFEFNPVLEALLDHPGNASVLERIPRPSFVPGADETDVVGLDRDGEVSVTESDDGAEKSFDSPPLSRTDVRVRPVLPSETEREVGGVRADDNAESKSDFSCGVGGEVGVEVRRSMGERGGEVG